MKFSIVSVTENAPGAISLGSAIVQLGHNVSIISSKTPYDEILRIILESDVYIPRVGPKTYDLQIKLLKDLEKRHCRTHLTVRAGSLMSSFDKYSSFLALREAGVPTPETVLASDLGNSNLKFPLIIKPRIGNQGHGIRLVEAQSDINEQENEFIAQEYFKDSAGADIRVFVVGREVVACMNRESTTPNEFRSNLSLGGKGIALTASDELKAIALNANQAFGLCFSGVDIIKTSDGYRVIEVNCSPGFKISEVTGVDVAEKVVKYLVSIFGGEND